MMANIKDLLDSQPLPKSILQDIGKLAEKNNKQVYVVGGVVRGLFLGRKLKEIDLMVIGDGIEFAKQIANSMAIKKLVPFSKFSTAHIPAKPIPIEVAAARQETYTEDSRKPNEIIYTDLHGDLILMNIAQKN